MDVPNFPDPTLYAVPFFVITYLFEWWAVKKGHLKGNYETKDAIASVTMGLGSSILGAATGFVALFVLGIFYEYRIATLPFTLWSFLLVFFLGDLLYYWKHRAMHVIRWFWMEHVTHHSSQHYNLTTALRQPWFGNLTGLYLFNIPLALLGFHPAFIALSGAVNLVYQYWIHTEAIDKMPRWFEAVMNTPSHHRVHHATNPRYLDSNYAGVFIIWDKMFGTFVPELDDDKPDYGLVHNIPSHNPFYIAYHEAAGILRDCYRDGFAPVTWGRRLINAPGWSPDGEHSRSCEIKAAFVAANPDEAGKPGLPPAA